jgi:hypothetical protein
MHSHNTARTEAFGIWTAYSGTHLLLLSVVPNQFSNGQNLSFYNDNTRMGENGCLGLNIFFKKIA